MTTRKPKLTLESMIELPAELQLATVTVEQKGPARDARTRHSTATELPVSTSLPRRGKITLH